MATSFGVSLGLHVLVIAAFIWFPADFGKPRLPPGPISVSLVSLPGPGPAPGPPAGDGAPPKPVETPKPVEAPKPAPPPEKPAVAVAPPPPPKPAEVPKPEVSTAPPKLKEKKSLKETTRDNQKMIERAIERIEKKVNEPDTSSVASAIDRLKKKFADEPRPGPPAASPGQGGGGGPAGGAGGGGGGPGQIEPVDIYRATVASQVGRNWAFPPQLAGAEKSLQVKIVFDVMPNGEITNIRYTERSNNSYLDDSVYRAIAKSNPAMPHPAGVKAPYVTVALRFTPEGLR